MQVSRTALDQQADRVEAILASLALPSRIQGGEVDAGWVRYHFAPLSEAQVHRLRQAAPQVAQAMGVYQVHVAQAEQGLTLAVPQDMQAPLSLLACLARLPQMPPLVAVLGQSDTGKPFLLNLCQPNSWHFLALGPAQSGKSELLRTLLLSLALHSRQAHVQFLGIDVSGRELTLLEGLPHALTDVAHTPQFAAQILNWLEGEVQRRKTYRLHSPHIMLFLDGFDRFGPAAGAIRASLKRLSIDSQQCGLHFVLAGREPLRGWFARFEQSIATVTARAAMLEGDAPSQPGLFQVQVDQEQKPLRAAWLPAHDLQRCVRMVQQGRTPEQDLDQVAAAW